MKRVYVAGAYSSDNVLGMLSNMRKGMKLAKDVLLRGYAPFTPWHDFHHTLMLDEGEELFVHAYHNFSMSWLEVSDAVLLVPGWENSKGTATEIKRAQELNIPIFYELSDLTNHFDGNRTCVLCRGYDSHTVGCPNFRAE